MFKEIRSRRRIHYEALPEDDNYVQTSVASDSEPELDSDVLRSSSERNLLSPCQRNSQFASIPIRGTREDDSFFGSRSVP